MGDHDFSWEGTNVPEQITRLTSTLDPRTYDLLGMGPGPDVAGNDDERYNDDLDRMAPQECSVPPGEVRVVKDLDLGFFRSRLVEHFNILWKQGKITWPSRRGPPPDVNI